MRVFKTIVSGQAPLRIQLTAAGRCKIIAVNLSCEGLTGNVSLPSLSRPSTVGTGTGAAEAVDGFSTPASTVITSFSSAPTLPSTGTGAYNIPWNTSWLFRPDLQPEVLPGGSILLYANATAGLTLSGELTWGEL